jgi:diaminopimelate decarboxylase
VESEGELELLSARAVHLKKHARIALRVNPDVAAETHPYIATGMREHKFGVDMRTAERLYQKAAGLAGLEVVGVSCHIGSQLLDFTPLLEALDRLLALTIRLREAGLPIRYLDIGGGLGVPYKPGDIRPDPAAYVKQILAKVAGSGLTVMIEPGRSIVAEAGGLLTRVINRKTNGSKHFVIVDAAMNDLLRPALYQAYHQILPIKEARERDATITADVVGPVCETGDFLARGRAVPCVESGDLLVFATAGAYGSVLGSNYNARPKPPEVLVDGRRAKVIRRRESMADLVRNET